MRQLSLFSDRVQGDKVRLDKMPAGRARAVKVRADKIQKPSHIAPSQTQATQAGALQHMHTQGIKYAGSKLKIIPHILELVRSVKAKKVLDGFAGTTRVSQALARTGHTVMCNDIAIWSQVFGTCYLLNTKTHSEHQQMIDHLNNLPPTDGWFTQHYGGHDYKGSAIQKDGKKRPWQIHNTRKLDAIRQEIENLKLNPIDKAVALTSLILALDKVDNSLGHFSSYLKNWAPRSYKILQLQVPNIFMSHTQHQVLQQDVFTAATHADVDVAYFDPPYGSNNEKMPASRVRYASYYHIWKSVILFDTPPLFGKVGRRCDTSDTLSPSPFEEFRKDTDGRFLALKAIERLISLTRAPYIILSYSSGGRATAADLQRVMARHGKLLRVVKLDYKKNVMSGMKWTHEWLGDTTTPHQEFLFLLKKWPN